MKMKNIDMFWKLTYENGNTEFTVKPPYAKGVEISDISNVVKFELVKALKCGTDASYGSTVYKILK